jgi:hypothetical protein
MEILGLQPGAEPGIVNFWFILPKTRLQPALNLEMTQLQLDDGYVLGEIAPHIGTANVQSGYPAALGLCFDYHRSLLTTAEEVVGENQSIRSRKVADEIG